MADNARASSLLGHRDIQVIPNCIDTERFCPGEKAEACQSLGLDPDKKHILFAAMSAMKDKNKGYAFLKAALQQVASDISDQAELVLIGDNYTIEDGFNEMKVINLGVLRDMVSIVGAYRAADVTVVPSLSENLSCTIMESLSCGTPAVAFDIGGNGDMIRHRSNGYLAREKDPRDLADGIAWCLAQEGDGLSLSARQTVENLFTPQIIGAKYAGLYEQLMSRP